MNQTLNESLIQVVDKVIEISKLPFDHPDYEQYEDQLHDLEEQLLDLHGEALKEGISHVHDEYCPDIDPHHVSAYIGRKYSKIAGTDTYDAPADAGLAIEMDDFRDEDTFLVILPNPARIRLSIGGQENQTVWSF